ncbi:MAG: hypothetical protein QM530_05120 [Phycisphaerales bacterium]|nr:hypothetical protein [Phycisphaerales bacterium]
MQKIINKNLCGGISFAVLFSFFSCKGQNAQMQCYSDALKEMKKKPVYTIVQTALKDTLTAWTDKKLKGVWSLKHFDWKIDEAVFFSNKEDKAILLILERDTQKIVKFGQNDHRPPSQDQIETVFAYIKNGRWQFYTYTMPVMAVVRSNYGKTAPMSFEELSQIGRKETLHSYYKQNSCQINLKIFEIDEAEIEATHLKFLDNNSAIYQGMQEDQ